MNFVKHGREILNHTYTVPNLSFYIYTFIKILKIIPKVVGSSKFPEISDFDGLCETQKEHLN